MHGDWFVVEFSKQRKNDLGVQSYLRDKVGREQVLVVCICQYYTCICNYTDYTLLHVLYM